MLFEGFLETVREPGNRLRRTMTAVGMAPAQTQNHWFLLRFSNDFALELTPSPGASPTHGQGTVTVCAPRNDAFVCFPNVLKGFGKMCAGKETMCGGLWAPVQEKQGFPMVFTHFQSAALRRLGRGQFVKASRPECALVHSYMQYPAYMHYWKSF